MSGPIPGRRQSTRQVRTTTTRPTNYYARNFSGRSGAVEDPASNPQPGFFPAIAHFTDAVDALPKDIIKHFSMLKEVDAKVHPQDKELRRIAGEIANLPPPPRSNLHIHEGHFPGLSLYNSVNGSRNASVQSFTPLQPPPAGSQTSTDAQPEAERRKLFSEMNRTIMGIAPMLDEKIAVLNTANDTLKHQLMRMESSYVHVSDEISPEARWGSTSHWAYVTDKETKKSGPERSRRDAAGANTLAAAAAQLEGDHAARSEARREAMQAKYKGRKHAIDSDFDDAPASRKVAKTKKTAAAGEEGRSKVGLGITNGVKKRKNAAAQPMERAMSAALHGRLPVGSPRETPAAETSKKRTKAAPGPAPKKRIQGAGGASPHLVSSPLVGTFGAKEAGTSRPTTSRGRQNSYSVANAGPAQNRPPSSSSNRPPNGLRVGTVEAASAEEVGKATDIRQEQLAADAPGSRSSLQPTDAALKREEADNNEEAPAEADQAVVREIITRAGRTSKTATPLTATFPDFATARNRNTRAKDNSNGGSHASSESGDRASIKEKRTGRRNGATPSLLAERRKAAIEDAAKDDDSPVADDASSVAAAEEEASEGDVDAEDVDDNEPRYCYCNGVSYGEMVACDNENCPREWFHLKCAGLKEAPGENTKWYCRFCQEEMEKVAVEVGVAA